MKKILMAALATLLLVGVAAADMVQHVPDKQVGGSTKDSSIVAADTSAVVTLSAMTDLIVTVWADSASIYKTIYSPNGVRWYLADADTVAASSCEFTASLGKQYAGMAVRVILDKIASDGSGRSRAIIQEYRD